MVKKLWVKALKLSPFSFFRSDTYICMGQLYTETIPVCNLVELDGVEYKKFPDVTPENGYIYLAKFEGDEELDPVILAYARDHWWTGKETRPVVLWAKLPR